MTRHSAAEHQPSHPPPTAALLHLIGGAVLTWAIWVIAPLVPAPWPLLSTLVASACLTAAAFLALYGLAGLTVAAWHELAGLLLFGGLWWLVSGLRVKGPFSVVLGGGAGTLFMLACGFFGRLLARFVREPNILLAVLLTAGIADIFTVTVGPTRKALEHAPGAVRKLSMAVPKPGSAAGKKGAAGLTMAASIGLGDFIFAAMFLTAAARHGLDAAHAAIAAACLVVVAMALVLAVPSVPAMPLLPFIVVGMLAANWRRFRLSRAEAVQLALGGLFLAGLLAAIYLALR